MNKSQITTKWFWIWISNHFQIIFCFSSFKYISNLPLVWSVILLPLYFEMVQRNLKLFKWEGFQMEFKSGLSPHSLSFKIWGSHFISSLEIPWVAWSLNYFWMKFQIISNGNTFGKVLLFPLIHVSKVFKFHSISHNQTNNHKYLINITFQNLEFWVVTNYHT